MLALASSLAHLVIVKCEMRRSRTYVTNTPTMAADPDDCPVSETQPPSEPPAPAWHEATTAVHAGREDLPALGVHAIPIDLSTTNPLPDIEAGGGSYENLATGGTLGDGDSAVYRRLWSPTVARLERAVAALEDPEGAASGRTEAVAFATGMAAIAAVFTSCVRAGRGHVVAVRPLYGGTDHILANGVTGTDVTYVSAEDAGSAINERTGVVVCESPANPTLELLDISALALRCGSVPVMVDNTFATPVLQKPLLAGAGIVVHSATKYIGGHGDAMGGIVITDSQRARQLRSLRAITGGLLDPFSAYLLLRGLPTLGIRMRQQQENAGVLAQWLATRPEVATVFYPGLPGATNAHLLGSQMTGPGAMVSIDLAGGYTAAERLCSRLQLVLHAVSLGGFDTLIQHPAALTHRPVAAEAKPGGGVLRISVGLEDPRDIIADFEQALR
ncbi:MAG: hypothetical protein RL745_1007 [Actinomycetota bacterium]|jgi:methionine-gamma-lyase